MAETLATLAFLSAIAMLLSTTIDQGKWLASLTAIFCALELLLSHFDSIQQPGGSVLAVAIGISISIQYHIHQGVSKKYLNGMGGVVIFVILLAIFPEEGLHETINGYSRVSNILELVISLSIGLLIAQLLVNSIAFDKKISISMVGIIAIMLLWTDLMQRSPLITILASCILIGFMPFAEDKINSGIGSGRGRSIALGIPILLGIILIFVTTYVSISTVNRIGTGSGAVAVSLWLTAAVTGMGLIGMLLPLLGFDDHPRPEAWGWRFSLALSPMILTLQTDLAGHVFLGILLAIVISISAPLVLENNRAKAV